MDCILCPVCQEMFGQKEDDVKCPRNLSCGHTFCTECLIKISKRTEENYINCPICRRKGSENKDVNSIAINRLVFDLIRTKNLSDSMQIKNLDNLKEMLSSQENIENSSVEGVKESFEINKDAIIFKIITLGASGTGKTSLIRRYTTKTFTKEYKTTIALEFSFKHLLIDNQPIKIYLFDTAGAEVFQSLTSSYIRGTHGCLLVFDLASEENFKTEIKKWLQFLKDFNDDKKIAKILVGNKLDLETERKVDRKEAEKFASENGLKYIETSACTGKSVDKVFNLLARTIMDNYKKGKEIMKDEESISIKKSNLKKKKRKCFC